MKLAPTLLLLTLALGGCGTKTRTPAEWTKELGDAVQSRGPALGNCLSRTGAPTSQRITVWVHIRANRTSASLHETPGDTITVEAYPELPAENAWYPALSECVVRVLERIPTLTDDRKVGEGDWAIIFEALPSQQAPVATSKSP